MTDRQTLEKKLLKIRPYIDLPARDIMGGEMPGGSTMDVIVDEGTLSQKLPPIRVFLHLQPTALGDWNAFYAAPGIPVLPKNLYVTGKTPAEAITSLQKTVDLIDLFEKPTVKGEDVPKDKK